VVGGQSLGFTPESGVLDIAVDAEGIAHVTGTLDLPGEPHTVHAILTDYAQWPSLFSKGMSVLTVRHEPDGVITDLSLPRYLLPGTLRLVILTQTPTLGQIEARLIDGDFDHFRRLWEFVPLHEGRATRARLQMDIRPKGWLPRWLLAYALRRELQEHFQRLRAAVEARR
jgi:ribosome-associated toxin RatA of RatAB toxin-antitoxin module